MNMTDQRPEREFATPRLIVALDFGTTYTGVAYTIASGSTCEISDISVVREWDTEVGYQDKIPSATSYSLPPQAMKQRWASDLSREKVTMVHTKLELNLQHTLSELEMTLQMLEHMQGLDFSDTAQGSHVHDRVAYVTKSPEDIVANFLTRVFHRAKKVIGEVLTSSTGRLPIDFIFTVPTDWSYTPTNLLHRAMAKAGVNQAQLPNLANTISLSEAEAGAYYVARSYSQGPGQELLEKDQYIMFCDAGGYKVNVVAYHISFLQNAPQLEQIGNSLVDKCGSSFIDRAFLIWLRETIGEKHYRCLDPDLQIDKLQRDETALHSFEGPQLRYVLRQFDEKKRELGQDSGDCHLVLPAPLDDISVGGAFRHGRLKISRKVMVQFFETTIPSILSMIQVARESIQKKGAPPAALFLVGGFAESKYLQEQLEDFLGSRQIRIYLPPDSSSAIVQGAVLCGVEKDNGSRLRRMKHCRYSYAICLDKGFEKQSHPKPDPMTINTDQSAPSQLCYLLDEGAVIFAGAPRVVELEFDISFPRSQSTVITFPIYRYQGEVRPTRRQPTRDELETACELNIDLARVGRHSDMTSIWKRIPRSYGLTLKLIMILDWDRLTASLECKGTELARAIVDD